MYIFMYDLGETAVVEIDILTTEYLGSLLVYSEILIKSQKPHMLEKRAVQKHIPHQHPDNPKTTNQ
jgi:hypothetical protein